MQRYRFNELLKDALRSNLDTNSKPNIPAGGGEIWRWFNDLSRSRSYHAAGPNPITYTEIAAYCLSMRIPMRPHHIDAIRMLDDVFLNFIHGSKPSAVRPERKSSGALTAGLFDAMFG